MGRTGAGRTRPALLAALLAACAVAARAGPPAPVGPGADDASPFAAACLAAEKALADGNLAEAVRQADRALERDAKSPRAWDLRARWAAAAKDADEEAYALHREHALLLAQTGARKAAAADLKALRARLEAADPLAKDLLDLGKTFLERLLALAKEYEKAKRPHAAIRVYREALAIAPDREDLAAAIQRVASAPDPSLADSAKARDLLADVSEEWIRRHDAEHATWEARASLERENYVTETDAGYSVLVRSAEAMEQMNAFYRRFFRYGTEEDGKKVPRIALRIFATHDEYLKLGKGPPVDWSGGQFTGDSVEVGGAGGGIEGIVGILFHEAAHQFVSLATSAAGWMNEGLASYFEGSRILANGTVVTNLPANHRLFPLVEKMERGWMESASDGIDPADPSKSDPPKAPTFRIVLENEYAWGPPWYAPTWGVVYFLWNYEDPADGRFVYRDSFREYVNASGGKVGKSAIATFEEVVLARPKPPTKGVAAAKASRLRLPKTVDEVDDVWKEWLTALRDEQIGATTPARPWLAWARHAVARKDWDDAAELFGKGLERSPQDVDLLVEFADLLAERFRNADRASRCATEALRVLEAAKEPDGQRVAEVEARLSRWDPKRPTLEATHRALWAAAQRVARGHAEAGRHRMTMYAAWRFGADLGVPGLEALYEAAVRASSKSLALWQLAYDERSLSGWSPDPEKTFQPYGSILRARGAPYKKDDWSSRVLECETVTSGDYAFEAQVRAEPGKSALCGLVFGRKSGGSFHAAVFFPEGWVDLVSFLGAAAPKTWRHNPVAPSQGTSQGPSQDPWRRLRVEVSGGSVDLWVDGEPVASQDFGEPDVLRGGFGLVTGVGECEFREVRVLVRARNDAAARIERAIRLERRKASGAPVAGSYVGLVPPFPSVAAWLQGPRERWDDRGPVPTLLVLWSRRQNDRMPLDAWLTDLVARHAPTGLEVVAVGETGGLDRVREYLAAHPFPGAVGVDRLDRGKSGFGDTFDAFFVGSRFSLPRLLLLDVDGRVVWEGSPGFDVGQTWKPGEPSYLDDPLADLARRRRLVALRTWLASWKAAAARDALPAGRWDAALGGLLAAAKDLPGDAVPEVAWAQARAKSVEEAVAAFDKTADAVLEQGAAPAVAVLAAWGGFLGRPVDPAKVRGVRRAAAHADAQAWKTALAHVEKARKDVAGGADAKAVAEALLARLAPLSGRFPKDLAERLSTAAAAGDAAGIARALDDAPRLPAAFLARDVLNL